MQTNGGYFNKQTAEGKRHPQGKAEGKETCRHRGGGAGGGGVWVPTQQIHVTHKDRLRKRGHRAHS